MTYRKPHGAVISHRPSALPGVLSFMLTGALIIGAFLLTFTQALAA